MGKDIINEIVRLWLESGKTSEDFLWEWHEIHNKLYLTECLREGQRRK